MNDDQSMGTTPTVVVRRLRRDDIAFADALRATAGWNQSEHDWAGYLEFEPDGCFLAEVNGRPAGTATTIAYAERFGWIGMVLVHPDQRRLGVGSRLLREAIGSLQRRGVRCIKLDATPMGKKVYVPLGFVEEYELTRYEGTAPVRAWTPNDEIAPLASADFVAVVRLDALGFGAERERVLRSLSARHPELSFVARRMGEVVGFLLAREGANAVQVGPWVARDAAVADQLLLACFERTPGRRMFIDVVGPNSAANEIVRRHGFTVQRTLTRMFLGENAHPGETSLVYGISSPEKG